VLIWRGITPMSDDMTSFDPYLPPAESAAPVSKGGRTGGLTVVCVLAIVLGALGLLAAVGGMVGLAFGQQMQTAFTPPTQPGVPQEMMDLQQEMQEEMMRVANQYWSFNLIALLAHVVVASGLLVGGILTMQLKGVGRTVLMSACGIAIVFELARGVLQAFVQRQTFAVVNQYMERLLNVGGATGGAGARAQEMTLTIMKVAMYAGLALLAAWIFVKVIYFSLSIWYLSKPKIQALFQDQGIEPYP
jgi:hypothetical protein